MIPVILKKKTRNKQERVNFDPKAHCKVKSKELIIALGGHFATIFQEVDLYEAFFFLIINFQKEKVNTFILLIILIVKSL